MLNINTIHNEDCIQSMKMMPDEPIQYCVTSPPYWRLRDYGTKEQIGIEPNPEEYIKNLVAVFAEVKRVLKSDGTVWLNIGDAYWS